MAYFAETDKKAFEAIVGRLDSCVKDFLRPRMEQSDNGDLRQLHRDIESMRYTIKKEYIPNLP